MPTVCAVTQVVWWHRPDGRLFPATGNRGRLGGGRFSAASHSTATRASTH